MAQRFGAISDTLKTFILEQKIYFVGTAAAQGRVNISPKGMDSFRVLDANRILWLNVTGSGNETAAHLQEDPRMTIMFCAFEGKPMILRLYGEARTIYPEDEPWEMLAAQFEPLLPGARQIIDMKVDLVQTSCGMGVPFMDYSGEREALNDWAKKKGDAGIQAYWEEKNQQSIDGKLVRIGKRATGDD